MKIYSFVFQEEGLVSHFSLCRFIFNFCFQHGPISQLSLGLWADIQAFPESKFPIFLQSRKGIWANGCCLQGFQAVPMFTGSCSPSVGSFPRSCGWAAHGQQTCSSLSLVSDVSHTTCCLLSVISACILVLLASDVYTLAFYVPLEGTRGRWVFPFILFCLPEATGRFSY